MSTAEATPTPVPVEEVKPTETATVTESSAPVAEAPKAEDVETPVRLICWFLCFISPSLTLFFFSPSYFKEVKKVEATEVGLLTFSLFLCSPVPFFFDTGGCCTRCQRRTGL